VRGRRPGQPRRGRRRQGKGIEATAKLAESQNTKVVIVGSGKDGLPVILGGQ